MGRFKISLDLLKRSLSVVAKNKALLLFPAIALAFYFIVALFFLSPFVLQDTGHTLSEPAHWMALGDRLKILAENNEGTSTAIGFTYSIFLYLIAIFIGTFFNTAFYHEILNALNGNRVSIARGMRVAMSKIKLIFIWAMFAGSVGIMIRTIEERLSIVGRWVLSVIGIAWSVASIFVIPVIIREEKTSNPLKLLKSSALILKRTWGESVIGFVGIGSMFIIGLVAFIPIFIIVLMIVGETVPELWALIAMLLLFFISMLIFCSVWSLIDKIYRCALYIYASEGVVPGPYDEEMMTMAWKVKAVRKA